jgi:hypothetical protein
MYADANRSLAIEVNGNRINYLLLKIAKVFALCGDTARSVWIVPPCHHLARLFVSLDLKCNFFHFPGLDYSQRQSRHVIL